MLSHEIDTTLDFNKKADILITNTTRKTHLSSLQLVFASARTLYKQNLAIIDQGPWGKVVSLTGAELADILQREKDNGDKRGVPSWIRDTQIEH